METHFATTTTLRSLVRVPRAERGAPLVLALHGWGMTARAFQRWLQPGIDLATASWWVPRGPLPLEVRSRKIGYAWYVFDGDQDALKASMDEAAAYLAGLVATARRQLAPASVTLLGFSQGAYLGSYAALTRPDLYDRLVVCCGRPKAEFVPDLDGARATRVLVQSGARDESVKPELIAKGVGPLRAAGLAVEEKTYEAAHRLTAEMAADAARFAG